MVQLIVSFKMDAYQNKPICLSLDVICPVLLQLLHRTGSN